MALFASGWWWQRKVAVAPRMEPTLDTPSPALGRMTATAIHQALTDPYFIPLERTADFLGQHSDVDEITVEQLQRYMSDDELPTCFVWSTARGNLSIGHPTSPWVLERVVELVKASLQKEAGRGVMFVDTFSVESERYWLGYLRSPLRAQDPRQVVGVFFSRDQYLSDVVPRWIENLASRRRFPLIAFQRNEPPIHNEPDGDVSIRILRDNGEVYLQRGRSFEPWQLIYSESKYYPKPVVCMQPGWDLQVFSKNAEPKTASGSGDKTSFLILGAGLLLFSIAYWWGVSGGVKS